MLLAATDGFKATFIGKGGHGAYPHLCVDPIVTAAEAVVNLQQFVSREYDPTDSAVVTVGVFRAGTATNVIPDTATIEGTARTISAAGRKHVRAAVERRLAGIAAANGCQMKFTWVDGYPPTVNDQAEAEFVAATARAIGTQFLPVGRPSMGGEDFAYYLEKIPGCFFLVGVEPPGRPDHPALHTDRYDFTDDAIAVGVRMFVELVRGNRRS